GRRQALDTTKAAWLRLPWRRPQDARPLVRRLLRIGPVVEVLAAGAAGREPPDVRSLGVRALQLLVREVAVLVPLLLLGDAEVDEGLVPDVRESHGSRVIPLCSA